MLALRCSISLIASTKRASGFDPTLENCLLLHEMSVFGAASHSAPGKACTPMYLSMFQRDPHAENSTSYQDK